MKTRHITSALTLILTLSCGDHRYDQDRMGTYGKGPLVTPCGNQCTKEDYQNNAKKMSEDIRASDPKFEELYFRNTSMESSLRDILEFGYVKKSNIRLLKLSRENNKVKAIVFLADLEGKPTTDYQNMKLTFAPSNDKTKSFPVASVTKIFDQHAEKIYLGSVLDYSGSMSNDIQDLENACSQLYASIPGIYGSVTKFNSESRMLQTLTQDISQLQNAIHTEYELSATALFDGILAGLQGLRKNDEAEESIKIQVVFTDGVDNASKMTYEALKSTLKEFKIPQIILGMGTVDIKSLYTLASDTNGLFYYMPGSEKIESSMHYVSQIIQSLLEVEIDVSSQPEISFSDMFASVKDKP